MSARLALPVGTIAFNAAVNSSFIICEPFTSRWGCVQGDKAGWPPDGAVAGGVGESTRLHVIFILWTTSSSSLEFWGVFRINYPKNSRKLPI